MYEYAGKQFVSGGSDLKSVMERMGHAQIQTTQKYLHTLPGADQENLEALDRVSTSRRKGATSVSSLKRGHGRSSGRARRADCAEL